jgi:hypothetical protein
MKKCILLDEDGLGRLATASLIGLVMEDGVTELEITFLQSSLSWREKNGGPNEWIILEYNVPCLLADVVKLVERGVKVTIKESSDARY